MGGRSAGWNERRKAFDVLTWARMIVPGGEYGVAIATSLRMPHRCDSAFTNWYFRLRLRLGKS